MKVLEALDLSKSYQGHPAVQVVNLDVKEGEIVGLLGPNGAGKTTTMHMLAGLLQPDGGQVRFMGKPFCREDRAERMRLGMVPQTLAIYPELTARENLHFFGKLYGLDGERLRQSIKETLTLCNLTVDADRNVNTFSHGMKRKLNFGLGVLHAPRMLILDEPTVGVDVESRVRMLESIRQLAGQGVGVLFASHYLREVETLFDRVAILKKGKMVTWSTTDALMQQADSQIELTIQGANREWFDPLADQMEIQLVDNHRLRLSIPGRGHGPGIMVQTLHQVIDLLQRNGAKLLSIRTQQPSLEQIYFEVTGHSDP